MKTNQAFWNRTNQILRVIERLEQRDDVRTKRARNAVAGDRLTKAERVLLRADAALTRRVCLVMAKLTGGRE